MITDTGSSNISYVADVDTKLTPPSWKVNSSTTVFNPSLIAGIAGAPASFIPRPTGLVTTMTVGGFNDAWPWPVDLNPYPGYPTYPDVPYPLYPVYPMPIMQPWITTTISNVTGIHTFKATVVGDSIELRLDVPGVTPNDVLVDIENGFVKVSATRSDTKINNTQSHYVGLDYDARTCEATVEHGVLTITIKKHKEKLARRIPVKVK